MLRTIKELSPLAPTTIVMVVLGAVALFILFLLWVSPRRRKQKGLVADASPVVPQAAREVVTVPPIPKAEHGAIAKWLVLDLQTTGLSTQKGAEDLIVEATWLLLDQQYQLIRRQTLRVRQANSGSEEAREVHGLSQQDLWRYGVTETQLVEQLLADLRPETTIVMHNAEFDRAILRGTIQRVAPYALAEVDSHSTLCTMTYLPSDRYPSLGALTTSITSFTQSQFRALRPISYRNAYFTRHCLIALLQTSHSHI